MRELSAGLDYHGIRGTDVADIFDEAGTQIRTDIGSGRQRLVGGYVQADLRPARHLDVLLSGRYQDFFNYKGVDLTPGGLGTDVPDRHDTAVDPRLSLRYELGGGFALGPRPIARFARRPWITFIGPSPFQAGYSSATPP